jgi:Glycosyltransferase
MKILLVSNMYPSEKYPNYGVFVKNTEEILGSAGFSIDRVVMHKETNRFVKLFNYAKYYASIILKGLFSKYDVIYVHYASHNALPLIILKWIKKRIKIYTNVHGGDIVPESNFSQKLQVYVKQLLRVSDKVIAPSMYYKSLVGRKYGIDEEKIFVFPSGGVNSHVFHVTEDKEIVYKKLNLDMNTKYIGYVGRIDYKKGWDILLQAINLLKAGDFLEDKRFIIVGSGKQDSDFERMVEKLDLGRFIIRYNMLPQSKLFEIYNSIELFCFPTMREGESLGLVGLEAMACGVPVVGSRMGGLLDYIRDGENGLFFEPGDIVMLKDKITEYFGYIEDRKRCMKEEAVKTSERYRVENIRENLLKIFA